MTHRALSLPSLRHAGRALAAALLACLALGAMAQDGSDPPGRVAYLNSRQGTISVSPNGDDSWYESVPNRPFTQGDRLWTDRGARAELYVGDTAIRMDEQTQLEITELGDQSLRLTVPQGRVQVRLRNDAGDQERVELGTGNLALVMQASGDYRVQADPQTDTTQVMVAQGSATVFGENGQSQELGNRQQAVYTGRDLSAGGQPQALPAGFERWLAERGQAEEQSQSARYISREIPGYQQLDQYGQWQNDPTYGAVWYPSNVASDWAPYSDGYWTVVAPWGYTWIDRAPWGFAPSHYGRWTRIGPRWCWVPGPRHARPVYSPALVAFVGGAGGAIATHGGRPAVGWFPLAPGERWRPPYRASERYIDRANRTIAGVPPLVGRPDYANRSLPHAVTAVPTDRFGRGGPIGRRDFVRPPAPAVAAAPVSQRPPVPLPAVIAGGPDRDRRADFGFPGRRTQATPPPAIAALATPQADRFDRFPGSPGERRQRPPEPALRPPQLGQPGIALQQQQQQQLRQQQQQQFVQQEQLRQQRQAIHAQLQQQQMAQRQQAERFEQERQQLQQQQDNQRRIRQAQQDQERQQRDTLFRHHQVQQHQALQRQQNERAQQELRMQQAQQQAAMRDQMEQQQRQQQIERQQRQQQMDLQRQQRDMQQQQQQAMQRAQHEQAQRQAQIQQQQMRQQQEMQMRAQQAQQQQQQQQAQRERQQPGGPNRMRGVPGMADPQQR